MSRVDMSRHSCRHPTDSPLIPAFEYDILFTKSRKGKENHDGAAFFQALFTPAKTQRASEAIYNQIYPKIISGELRPGDRLPPERELAEMFQRSRLWCGKRCGGSSRRD